MNTSAGQPDSFLDNPHLKSLDLPFKQSEFTRPDTVNDGRLISTAQELLTQFEPGKVLDLAASTRAVDLLRTSLSRPTIVQYQVLELVTEHLRRALNPTHVVEVHDIPRLELVMRSAAKDHASFDTAISSLRGIEREFASANHEAYKGFDRYKDLDPNRRNKPENDRFAGMQYLVKAFTDIASPNKLTEPQRLVLYPSSTYVARLRRGPVDQAGIDALTQKLGALTGNIQNFTFGKGNMDAVSRMGDRVQTWVAENIRPTEGVEG